MGWGFEKPSNASIFNSITNIANATAMVVNSMMHPYMGIQKLSVLGGIYVLSNQWVIASLFGEVLGSKSSWCGPDKISCRRSRCARTFP